MTQYALYVYSRGTTYPGKQTGLTLVKYNDNGNVIEVQELDLAGTPYGIGDGYFRHMVYNENSVGGPFGFAKDNLLLSNTDYDNPLPPSNSGMSYKRLDVSGDIGELWDKMVLDAALRSSGDPSNYNFLDQVCNTYTVYLAENYLGINRDILFANLPDEDTTLDYYKGID